MKGKFGSADYAEEKLVAELGSAFLIAVTCFPLINTPRC